MRIYFNSIKENGQTTLDSEPATHGPRDSAGSWEYEHAET